MGVPKFFKYLEKKYKNSNFIFKKEDINNNNVDNIDWFLIDTNCLIHPKCFEVLAEEQEKTNINFKSLENKMINHVIEYIDKLIKYVKPKKGVYIAIDGPVCAAKMKQQRHRRFRSVHDKILFDKIKKKHNKEIKYYWNNSAISPGTKFMNKLHLKLLDYCKQQIIKIIYSSANICGEGEHKLLNFIKENNKNNIINSYLVYGLDADLIFLCLVTKLDNIFLLREEQHFDNSKSEKLNYISIKIMKDCIFESFSRVNINLKLDKNSIINDFVFLCYFLGNDFLPHLYSLQINKKGIEYLIEKYIQTFSELLEKKYILSKNTNNINQKFLKLYLEKLAKNENAILTKNNKNYTPRCQSADPYDKEIFKIENLQFKIEDPIGIGINDDYRINYYKHYFDVSDDELEEFAARLVENYLIGIKWVTRYYFNDINEIDEHKNVPDWNWFYPYDTPPFLYDISKYLINMDSITFSNSKPITPLEQLLIILPPQASYLLPKSLVKLVINPKSSLSYLYPIDIQIDFLYKHRFYEGTPLLPFIEIDAVKHAFKKYSNELNENEKKLNRLDNLFIFN